jgi:hypothetical protein
MNTINRWMDGRTDQHSGISTVRDCNLETCKECRKSEALKADAISSSTPHPHPASLRITVANSKCPEERFIISSEQKGP